MGVSAACTQLSLQIRSSASHETLTTCPDFSACTAAIFLHIILINPYQ